VKKTRSTNNVERIHPGSAASIIHCAQCRMFSS